MALVQCVIAPNTGRSLLALLDRWNRIRGDTGLHGDMHGPVCGECEDLLDQHDNTNGSPDPDCHLSCEIAYYDRVRS